MEIAFANKALRDICEIQLEAEHALGMIAAAFLRARLADIREATSVKDLVVGNPTIVSRKPPGSMSLDLAEGSRLIFCANHVKNPLNEKRELEWHLVSRIKVLGVGTDESVRDV